jgi:hypothetical protein
VGQVAGVSMSFIVTRPVVVVGWWLCGGRVEPEQRVTIAAGYGETPNHKVV